MGTGKGKAPGLKETVTKRPVFSSMTILHVTRIKWFSLMSKGLRQQSGTKVARKTVVELPRTNSEKPCSTAPTKMTSSTVDPSASRLSPMPHTEEA